MPRGGLVPRRSRDLLPHFLLFFLLLRLSRASDRPTLYAPGDNVLELDVNTFDKTVYHKPTAFFVEFYSSWCGHCIEYKPHYVRFATMLKDWRNVVVISVINCADEINAPICREHAIDGFPTLKYFHVNSKGKDDSVRFDENKRDLPLMASKITEWVKDDFDGGLAPKNWPRLEFAKNDQSLSDHWSLAAPNAHLLAVVVDNAPTTKAFSLMINYAGDPRVSIALCSPSHPILEKIGMKSLTIPGLLVFSKSDPEHPTYTSSSAMESWIEMQDKVDELLAPFPKPITPPLDSLKEPTADLKAEQHITTPPALVKVDWKQFEVQYLDLISALHYMLTVEIPRNPVLGNLELTALKRFIHLLRLHGPGSAPVRRLFFRLDEWLSTQHQPVVATDKYLSKLEEIQSDLGHPIPANTSYMACRGSKPYLRGYTCGIWTLFHILTVQTYKERHSSPSFDPVGELLDPIHQFVVQFLSCEVCSKNFDKMAREDGLTNVRQPEDAVLWLWRGHNKVNKRLKGEASEDPHFPKQQFPPPSICPECHGPNGFDEQKVLQFLLRYFSDVRIDNYKPAPTYTMKEFVNGKVVKISEGKLNPKFQPMAGKVDKLEEAEKARLRSEQEGGFKRQWKSIDEDFEGPPHRVHSHFVWLGLIAIALMVIYFKYRQNRSKFWKTFYYLNDYKVFRWRRGPSAPAKDLHKYSV